MKKHAIFMFLLLGLLLLAGCGAEAGTVESQTLPSPEVPGSEAPASIQTAVPVTEPSTEPPVTEAPVEPSTEPSAETQAPTEPGPEEAPTPEELADAMPLEEQVAQMLVVTPEALTGVSGPVTVARDTTRAAFEKLPVGGVLYMGQNLQNPEQVRALLAGMREISLARTGLPPFLCVDEEGGSVARISGNPAFGIEPFPNMAEIGATGDPEQARAVGQRIGGYLRELGFNLDFAPVADVWTNDANRVVRNRAFGRTAEVVIPMARACAEGLMSQGILPCYKHFPGHGGTAEDSHAGYAVLHMDLETLRGSQELRPFADAVEAEIPMIMVGHIALPEATGDDLPASLSATLTQGLLREELGYEGLLITDALNMGAIRNHYSAAETAVLAVQAGNDLLLIADDPEAYRQAILEAVERGEISRERIRESVIRILEAKLRLS